MKFIVGILLLLLGTWLTPWSRPQGTITVSGESREQISNQIARFNVSVIQSNQDKQTAVDMVNQAMAEIIAAVKNFGIEAKDLTTQNVSVYETEVPEAEIMIYPPRLQTGEKQWQASNSLEIILRDVNQASALTDLLTGFPLAQVSGPSLSVEDTGGAKTDLLVNAVEDARERAERMAQASGRRLGKVLTVSEGVSGQPWIMDRAVSAAPIEPGSSQMSKTVTVVFELK